MPSEENKQFDPEIEHQRLVSLINSMADGVIAIDSHGRIDLYNGAALNILDVNRIQHGASIDSVLKLLDKEAKELPTKHIILNTKRQVTSRDYKVQYADGNLINIYLSISPVRHGYGNDSEGGFVLILRDISQEKSLEEERDEFINVISHELRTPAATIEGAVSNALLLSKSPEHVDKLQHSLKSAQEQAQYLEDMINDLAALARAERDVVEDTIEVIRPVDLANKLIDTYSRTARDKGLELRLVSELSTNELHSVPLYVKEILQNFVTNAIKYTEKGSVTITVSDAGDAVQFTVHDTGIGISKNDMDQVFNKYFRSGDYYTANQKGTGLGLHVTKKLAKLVGAELSVESTLGEGSTFTAVFPNLK